MSDLKLELADPPSPEESSLLFDNVRSFNQTRTGIGRPRHVAYLFRDDEGTLIGGVQAMLWGRLLHIDVLWVDEKRRGEGLGSILMTAIEKYGAAQGHPLAYLETASFQALPFYKGLGYEVFGELPNIAKGHTMYFLKKDLSLVAVSTEVSPAFE